MKKKILKFLKYPVFFGFGALIFWLIYRDQDINQIKSLLSNDVEYRWIWLSLFLGLLSHISRSIRWNLMIEPLSHKPRLANTFLSVMVGYLMNLALPRMGEISRCGVLSRYEKISFAKLVGTVVTERIIDLIVLLLFAFIVFASQFGKLLGLLRKNPEIVENIKSILTSPFLWAAIIGIIVLIFIYRRTLKNSILFKKIDETLDLFKEGLNSVRSMKKKWAFIGHSLFIWIMYFLMLYVVFFSVDFTKELTTPIIEGLTIGLTTFVLASFGMVAPSPGGIGPWHFMAREALNIYGIDRVNGEFFALLMHTSMTLMLIIVGIISYLILPFINRRVETVET